MIPRSVEESGLAPKVKENSSSTKETFFTQKSNNLLIHSVRETLRESNFLTPLLRIKPANLEEG